MHQLRKYGAKLEQPSAADADAYTIWCALTAQTAWMDGLLRQMFFEDTLTVLDVEESAAGHHYWLNIITDLTEEEELGWMCNFASEMSCATTRCRKTEIKQCLSPLLRSYTKQQSDPALNARPMSKVMQLSVRYVACLATNSRRMSARSAEDMYQGQRKLLGCMH